VGGDFISVLHKPTGIHRRKGPPLPNSNTAARELVGEIEAELFQKGLTQHILPSRLPHLFTVTDRFQIENSGCVLFPGLSTKPGALPLRRGARIRLRTPEGREIDTFIKDLPMITYRKMPEKTTAPVLLPGNLTKDDVPVGTEVLSLDV
jgi:hypothetical protein